MSRKLLLGIALILMLLPTACIKEEPPTDDDPTASASFINKAKEFFDSYVEYVATEGIDLISPDYISPGHFAPQWDKAKTTQCLRLDAVLVPLNASNQYAAKVNNSLSSNIIGYEGGYCDVVQGLVIVKDKVTDNRGLAIVSLIVKRRGLSKSEEIISRFLNRSDENKFSGYALYTDFQGRVVELNEFEDNTLTKEILASNSNELSKIYNILDNITFLKTAKTLQTRDITEGYHPADVVVITGRPSGGGGILIIPGTPDPGPGSAPITPPQPEDKEDEDKCEHAKCPICNGCLSTSPTSKCSPCECSNITLVVDQTSKVLGDKFNLRATIKTKQNISEVRFYISPGASQSRFNIPTSGGATAQFCVLKAPLPGSYILSASAVLEPDYREIQSNTVSIHTSFPSVNQLIQMPLIQNALSEAWQKTLVAADNQGVKEYGGVVYLNSNSGEYTLDLKEGPKTTYKAWEDTNTVPQIDLSHEDQIYNQNTPEGFGKFAVMNFHTHPPLWGSSKDSSRATGPSTPDREGATKGKIPGVVCDFDGIVLHTNRDSRNRPLKYYIYGPSQREM